MPETSSEPPIVICVVDDDLALLQLLKILLDSEGLESQTFDNSEDFIDHARQHRVGLAILDVHMPRFTGLEVQQLLKEISPSTRVIIITGQDEPSLRKKAESNGAVGFLLKPFDITRFVDLVRNTLELARLDPSHSTPN
ncbi:MAG: DNA-binding response regulator FixJ [Chthoniobacteraceae bacterium]|nr:DNA-binding response regulator FixJ [Chthoniobacteraceae bacterium]